MSARAQGRTRKRSSKKTEGAAEEESVSVCMRLRPLLRHEHGAEEGMVVRGDARSIEVRGDKQEVFTCSRAFGPSSTQEDLFQESGVRDLLRASLYGYRATLFAYGQTGAGKTYTVLGESSKSSVEHEGIVPRSVREVFTLIEHLDTREIKLRISCLEIYREVVHDLLVPAPERASLQVREHPKYGFFVDGLFLKPSSDVPGGLATVVTALRDRHTGSHHLNARSSRSHCMLTIHIDSLPHAPPTNGDAALPAPPTYGSMSFVDLAGSERPKETGSTGVALREAGHINRSLYTLGKVISGMLDSSGRPSRRKTVPFRDSNLTKLLIGSLGGSSKTLMLGCLSPTVTAVNESTRTLQFAMQVKGIRNRPLIQLDPREKLIQDLRLEIERLREENARLKESLVAGTPVGGKTGEYLDESTLDEYSPSPSPGSERESEGGSGGVGTAALREQSSLPRVAEKIGSPLRSTSSDAASGRSSVALMGDSRPVVSAVSLPVVTTRHAGDVVAKKRAGIDLNDDRELEERLAEQLFAQLDLKGSISPRSGHASSTGKITSPVKQAATAAFPPGPGLSSPAAGAAVEEGEIEALLMNAGIGRQAGTSAKVKTGPLITLENQSPSTQPKSEQSSSNIAVSWRQRWEAEVQRMETRRAADNTKSNQQTLHVPVRSARRQDKAPFRHGRIIGQTKRGKIAAKRTPSTYGTSAAVRVERENKKEEIALLIRDIRMRNSQEGGAFVF
jgi:hypothetical protein